MTETNLDPAQERLIAEACDRLPTGLFLLSARHDSDRAGVLALGVHLCATEPMLICVPVRRGHRIEPLIRDSRAFAVCSVSPSDRAMRRRFERFPSAEEYHDPFDAVAVLTLESGAPILESSVLAFDCEVVRHVDMDADHELYIGRVIAARLNGEAPTPTRASNIGPLHLD
ncbi:MAG: flavin reductase family protein [Phycisphaerales bacterium]